MQIVWDEVKRLENVRKHRTDFALLTPEWFAGARIEPAKQGRWKAVGTLGGSNLVAVVFSTLGTEAISVISMRPASRQERRRT
jgi:uncharacterized DUF497 family protein